MGQARIWLILDLRSYEKTDSAFAFGQYLHVTGIDDEVEATEFENYLLKRGMRRKEALQALHEITAFEHKIHQEAENIRKALISIPILILLVLSGIIFLYLAGILKSK